MTVTAPSGARSAGAPRWRRALHGRVRLGPAELALGAAIAVYVALALWLTRGTTVFVDELDIFLLDHGLHPSALLAPLNGHLVLVQRLLYAVDFALLGPNFLVARLVEVGGAGLVVALFFVLVRRRIGAVAALPLGILLLFLGSAWELNFIVSGIGNVYALAAGLGALLALERASVRRDLLACALLVVAVSSFTLGVAFAVGVGVLVLLEPGWRRRLWVPAVPLVLWVGWLAWVRGVYVPAHGEVQHLQLGNVLLIPTFVADEASAVGGAVTGLNYPLRTRGVLSVFATESSMGPVLAALGAAALAVRLSRGARSPRAWAFMAILLAFWLALALGYAPGRNPTTVRYVYGGAILVLLLAAEAARGARIARSALVALYLVTLVGVTGNLGRLRDAVPVYRSLATGVRAQMTALELARGRVDPSFVHITGLQIIPAGPYLAAVDRIGSPAYSLTELPGQSEATRHVTDSVLVSALRIRPAPLAPGRRPGSCRSPAARPGSALTFPVRAPGVTLRARVRARLALRRFASASTVPVGNLAAGRLVELGIPPDESRAAWRLTVDPALAGLAVCPLGTG